MTKSKLAPGPQVTTDKMGRTLYWIDRKRVSEADYQSALASDKIDGLLAEVKRLMMPEVTVLNQGQTGNEILHFLEELANSRTYLPI
jgi:predicted lipoprotein